MGFGWLAAVLNLLGMGAGAAGGGAGAGKPAHYYRMMREE